MTVRYTIGAEFNIVGRGGSFAGVFHTVSDESGYNPIGYVQLDAHSTVWTIHNADDQLIPHLGIHPTYKHAAEALYLHTCPEIVHWEISL